MKKNLLTYLSYNFCVNCCCDERKFDCDSRNVTCDKLANFLIGCNHYKEEENSKENERLKDELDALNMRYLSQVSLWKSRYKECVDKACKVLEELLPNNGNIWSVEAFIKSFRRAMENEK